MFEKRHKYILRVYVDRSLMTFPLLIDNNYSGIHLIKRLIEHCVEYFEKH